MENKALINEIHNEENFVVYQTKGTGTQYKRLYDLIDATQKNSIPSETNVLDWGCGDGHLSIGLYKKGFNVSAFSLIDSKIENHDHIKFFKGSLKNPVSLPFEENSFDLIISCGVLEHVKETGGCEVKSLKEIRRVLKPNGHFICYHLPNKYSWIDYVTRIITPNKHCHDFRYLRKDIKKLNKLAGLKDEKIKKYGFLPKLLLNKLPKWLSNNNLFISVYYFLDDILSLIFYPFIHNYCFISKK